MTSLAETSRRAVAFAVLAGLAVAASAGCSSSTSNGSSGTSGTAATSGGASECKQGAEAPYANPAGTPLSLPAGVALEGEITGDITGDTKEHCKDAQDVEYASDYVRACVAFRNSGTSDVVVTLPAGLTFVAKTPATANGILVHSHDLTLPAGVTYFSFRPASLNSACSPVVETDRYTLGNVTNDPKLLEILALAKKKKVDGDLSAQIVDRMIWSVTDGNGISDDDRMMLAATPDQ